MRMTIERFFQTGQFKAGQNTLHALTLAALLAAGGLALTPQAAQAFICESTVGGGGGATDGGTGSNTACGNNADANGITSTNTALGGTADASGDASGNTATGFNANANGNTSFNTATGRNAIASGDTSSNIATGIFANASGDNSINIATGRVALAGGDNSFNIATGSVANASGNSSNNTATGRNASARGNSSNNTAMGHLADAIGNSSNNIAMGSFANASGSGTSNVALGAFSVSTGGLSTAVGPSASAAFANAAAFGNGATATRVNQQVLGTATNTYTMPGITSAASATAQGAPTRLVTSNETGDLAALPLSALGLATQTDISGIENRLDKQAKGISENAEGVAIALAMDAPDLHQNENFAVTGNWGNFEGENALAFAGTVRLGQNLTGNAGLGFGMDNGNVGVRAGLRLGW